MKALRAVRVPLSVMFALAGCATTSPLELADKDHRQHDEINRILDSALGPVPGSLNAEQQNEVALLRGQLAAAIVARYGARGVEELSDDRANDANRMLGHIERTQVALGRARAATRQRSAFFDVSRTDFRFAVLDMAGTAVEPSVRAAVRLVTNVSPIDRVRNGREFLRRVLEDAAYASAYQTSFKALTTRIASAQKITGTDWLEVNTELRNACARLNAVSGSPARPDCVPATSDAALF